MENWWCMRVRIEWIVCTTEPNMKPHSNSFQNVCMYIYNSQLRKLIHSQAKNKVYANYAGFMWVPIVQNGWWCTSPVILKDLWKTNARGCYGPWAGHGARPTESLGEPQNNYQNAVFHRLWLPNVDWSIDDSLAQNAIFIELIYAYILTYLTWHDNLFAGSHHQVVSTIGHRAALSFFTSWAFEFWNPDIFWNVIWVEKGFF